MGIAKGEGGGRAIAFGGATGSLSGMLVHDDASIGLPDRVRLPFTFDPVSLAVDLDQFAEHEWTAHFVRDNYQGDWSALPLRAAAGETPPDTADLYRAAGPTLCRHAAARSRAELPAGAAPDSNARCARSG
jgi:hypothetical protein